MLNTNLKNKIEKLIFPISIKDFSENKEKFQKDYSYAFNMYAVSTILDIDINMIEEYITDGTGDCGIDAIYIETDNEDIFNINFFQSKYVSFDNAEKGFVIGENEIKKVKNTILDIMNGKNILNTSIKLSEKINEIRVLQNSLLATPKIKLYLISNSENVNSVHYTAKNILEKEFVNDYFDYEDININKLFSRTLNNKKENYQETVTAVKDIMKFNISGVDGYVFNLKATELIKIYEKCGKEEIFSKNIRYFLKSSKINKEIQNTIKHKENSKYFWFLNNGISIIADAIEAPESNHDGKGNRRVKITNPSIINGGQTTRSLYNLSKEQPDFFTDANKNIDSIQVLIRAYQTTEETLIEKITKGTNRQNAISQKDLISNNKILKIIQNYFKDNSVNLEIKANEFINKNLKSTIKSDAIFQMYVAIYENKPHSSKNGKAKVLSDYSEKILNENKKDISEKLYRSYELWRFVNNKEKLLEEEFLSNNIFILNSTFSIMFLMTLLNKNIKKLEKPFIEKENNEIYLEAIKILREITNEKIKVLKDGYNSNLFFKSSESTILIENYITEKITFLEK